MQLVIKLYNKLFYLSFIALFMLVYRIFFLVVATTIWIFIYKMQHKGIGFPDIHVFIK